MVKKMALISLAVVLMLAMANVVSAKESVANTSQKGSLLVFPKIIAFDNSTIPGSGPDIDTYVLIGNDNTVGTWLKCYWMDNNQTIQDFFFYVTANQPIIFSSYWGGGGETFVPPFRGIGSLTCWASNEDDTAPRLFNHLYGNAMIRYGNGPVTADIGKAVFYNAYSFAGLGNAAKPPILFETLGTVDEPAGIMLRLTGDGPNYDPVNQRGYDACPQYLVFNFAPDGSPLALPNRPDLTLWPCRQDLRQDRVPTCTKAKFDIWNENEVKFTGAYQCFKCFFEGFLVDIGNQTGVVSSAIAGKFMRSRGPGYGGDKFTKAVLRTDVARTRVQGIYSTVCVASNVAGQPLSDPKTWVPSSRKGCPNIPANATDWASRGAAFSAAWGTSSAAVTPLLGVVMYALDETLTDPDNPIRIRPYGAYTPFGAGSASWTAAPAPGAPGKWGGWLKYDPGTGAAEAAKR